MISKNSQGPPRGAGSHCYSWLGEHSQQNVAYVQTANAGGVIAKLVAVVAIVAEG